MVHTYSSQHQDTRFVATNLLDKSKTYWLSQPGLITNQWIVFDFQRPHTLSRVSIQVSDFECTVKDFAVEVGDDTYTWRNVGNFQAQCGKTNQGEQFFDFTGGVAKYCRLFFRNNWGPGGGNYILVTKVRFFGAEGGMQPQPQYGQPQPQYGQPQQGYGQWISNQSIRIQSFSSQHQDTRFVVQNVLDPSKTYWLSQPGLITNQFIVFDFGRVSTITKIGIQVSDFECTIKDFNIENCDNDDTYSWRPVRSFVATSGKLNQGEQIFEGFQCKGRYLRLFMKNNHGPGGGNYILLNNIRFFGS